MFLDSTGRAYSLPAHTLPSARGQGEPLSGRLDPPDGATFAGVMIGEPDDRWVLASAAGYGFVVQARRAARPQPRGQGGAQGAGGLRRCSRRRRVPAADEALLAAVNSDGRLLVFPVADLPELPRGKGNKIFGMSSKKAAARARRRCWRSRRLRPDRRCGAAGRRAAHERSSYKDLGDYRGERGQRGAVLPRGWRRVEALEVTD